MSGRRAALRWLRTALFLSCVVACSSSDGASGPVGAGGSAGLADPGGGGGAEGAPSASVVREAPWPSWVSVWQWPNGTARVGAAFSLAEGASGCKPIATAGSCAVYPGICAFPPGLVSAGTLTVQSAIKSASLEIGKNGVYGEDLDTSLFSAGTSFTISASGAAFPGFHLVTKAPTRAMILGPKLIPGEPVAIPRHQDLEVMFDSDGDDVDFVVVSDEQTKTKPAARCTFPGATGKGRVPAEVLLLLPPGNAHLRGETRAVTDSVQPPVRVDTRLIATQPGGTAYGGPVTLLLRVRSRDSPTGASLRLYEVSMSLSSFRRRGAPVALLTYASFLAGLVPRTAYAEEPPPPALTPALGDAELGPVEKAPTVATPPSVSGTNADVGKTTIEADPAKLKLDAKAEEKIESTLTPPSTGEVVPSGLPTGADKTGVSSQAISVPQGTGKIQGMGESFSAQLSTGIATFSVPFAVPSARGAAQPAVGLSYSSSAGHGNAGVGWDVGWPYIARQTDRGLPRYATLGATEAWKPDQDRLVFNGGQELVPICRVNGGACAGALQGEVMPTWADGWRYFRPRVEGGFLRFFWSPDGKTWRVQDKGGVTMEIGVPLDGSGYTGALETDPANASRVFRWNLARQFDQESAGPQPAPLDAPVNVVVYRYSQDGGMAYLTDVYDTTPVSAPTTSALSTYAHHTRFRWEPRTDPTESWRRGWKTVSGLRLRGVDVASKGYVGASDARELVRRYHLAYEPGAHVSLLASVQVEGRCTDASGIVAITPEGVGEGFSDTTNCPRLPPMRFGYAHVTPYKTDGSPGSADLPGYEGFDERVITMAASPDHSLDEELTDLFDVNADGLPDVLVTAPGLYGGKHGVFVNGGGGTPNAFTQRTIDVLGVLGADANTLTLKNGNVSPQDLDGDGVIDFLHMPKVKTYSVYTPDTSGLQWAWKGREITTALQQSPKIDFGKDASRTRVVDINGDGLVDVLVSSGTRYQTFFALGRLPSGDGQFGNGAWTSRDSAAISNEPVVTCVPWAGSPVQLDDPDVRLGDMNGDGLADLVRIRHGDIRYWPGRGNGFFGTGALDDCPADTFGSDRHVTMATSPSYSDVNLDGIRLDDVNGDGLDDLVQIRFDAVDVWLNVDGKGWTPDRHIIEKSPYSPSFQSRTRLVDVNGSGTRDILWGDGNAYKYIDLLGGTRPWVMTRVENGLGKTTDLEYASSTSLMLAAEKAGDGWKRKAPMPLHVVVRTTERDHLNLVGRPEGVYVTEYTYRDPVYDGRQREFRGFSDTQVRKVGDANSPTSVETSQFLLGECVIQGKPCTIADRWMDNPREALKGLPVVVSSRAEATGEVLSTGHHTYRLRRLYKGLDERDVYHAFESGSQSFLYDVAAFVPSTPTAKLPELELEDAVTGSADAPLNVFVPLATGPVGRARVEGTVEVDAFGNKTLTRAKGCSDCAPVDPEIVSHAEAGRPDGDPSGWLWRTTHSWVEGEDGTKLHETYAAFDVRGRPTTTKAKLSGNLPLDRHPTLGIADAPMASSAGLITMSSAEEYDAFGHPLKQVGANGRCRTTAYDSAYADLVTSETIYVGANCTGEELTTFAGYDRGLEQVTSVTGMNGEQSLAVYDGFGRITTLHKPLPDGSIPTVHPSVRITYLLPSDPAKTPYARIHTETQDGATPDDAQYLESWGYVDGMGRPIVSLSEADPTSDGDAWVVSGYTFYDAKGAVANTCLPWFYGGDPSAYPLDTPPPTDCKRQTYDAFGRGRQTFTWDGVEVLRTVHHALSSDAWDAEDLAPMGGPHAKTPASVRKDGHGRTVQTTERIQVGQTLEERYVTTTYLPTGEPAVITRSRNPGDGVITRWMRYDSLGRMVLNVEPSTTRNFSADPSTATPGVPTVNTDLRAWRYAYSDSGDLVGTSDARQCGANFHYDGAGRLVAEDFSPCEGDHQAYSEPVLATGYGTEAQYIYGTAAPAKGRLVTVRDRGATTTTTYDYRGRATQVERQLAKPGVPSVDPDTRYAPRVYTQTMEYDGADRPTTQSTGAATTQLLSPTSTSTVTSVYSARGTIKRVDSAYGTLVAAVVRDAEGKTVSVTYGDAASTTTSTVYDVRRRVASVQTGRQAPAMWGTGSYPGGPWTTSTPTFQTTLEHTAFTYDDADNPTVIADLRDASAWPAGAKPVTRTMTYDDLYRVVGLQYAYAAGDDTWVSPFDAENTGTPDPRRAKPSPHVKFDKRMLSQSWSFDWVGNTTSTDDDAHGFYDRSLGTVTNDGYRLTAATQAGAKGGSLDTAYDDAGNLTGMRVVRSAADCLPVGATCSQRYAYAWDEIGRLVRARRWDMPNPPAAGQPPPSTTPDVELRYAYDATDDRVLKTAVDPAGNEVHTAYVFDSLELRRAPWEDVGGAVFDYRRDEGTEVAYLSAHGVRLARLVYEDGGVPEVVAGHKLHVFFELGDHLGSTSTVLDKESGELVEKGTFQAYGGAESDYRPERWKAFREDYRFTGKEEDVEVGLTYFGKRFLSTALGRWVSADPLAVHGLGADANAYAYVHGAPVRAVDPVGLQAAGTAAAEAREARATLAERRSNVVQLDEITVEGEVETDKALWTQGGAAPAGGVTPPAPPVGVSTGTPSDVDTRPGARGPRPPVIALGPDGMRALGLGYGAFQSRVPYGFLLPLPPSVAGDPDFRLGHTLGGLGQGRPGGGLEFPAPPPALVPCGTGALAGPSASGDGGVAAGLAALRWSLGSPIDMGTRGSGYPSWDTTRSRYWKNRAESASKGEFTPEQVARMRRGSAPEAEAWVKNADGTVEKILVRKELHHWNGNRGQPGFDSPFNLREAWPWEHEGMDRYRHLDYTFLGFAEP